MTDTDNGSGNPAPSLTLLIKLLKMTTSSHDNEAIVAIRKANAELAKFGGDWEALLRGKVTVIGDPFAELRRPDVGRTDKPRASAPPPPTPTPAPPITPTPKWTPPAWKAPPRHQPQPQPRVQPQAAAPKPTKPPAWSNKPKAGDVKLEELI